MESSVSSKQRLLSKIQQLAPEKIAEVESFVDSLFEHDPIDQKIAPFAAQLSEPIFHQIWDNPDDAEYDNL